MKKAVSTSLLLFIGLALMGCDGGDDVTTPPSAVPAPSVDIQPGTAAPVTPPPSVAPASSTEAIPPPNASAGAAATTTGPGLLQNVDQDYLHHLVNLNNAFQAFRSIEMRSPKDLNELITTKRLAELPPTPPGKKYQIDEVNLRIIVVSQ